MSERDEWAWRYFRLGWNPAVLCDPAHAHAPPAHLRYCRSPGKVPVGRWKAFQSRLRSAEELASELAAHPAGNLGLVLGEASGLAAIDVDSPAGAGWVEDRVPGWRDAPRFSTARGCRLLFRLSAEASASRVLAPGVELLAAGRVTVAPPSVHPSGHAYRWLTPGGPRRALPGLAWRPAAGGRPGTAPRPAPAAVWEEGTRNDRMFRLACALRRHGADAEEVTACLRVFNRRCSPPLGEADLRSAANSACRYAPR